MESAPGLVWVVQLFSGLLALGIFGLGVLTLLGFFAQYGYLFDICNHFRVQYLVLVIAFAFAGIWINNWILVWLGLAIALVNLILILPIFISPIGWKHGAPEYRLLLANVLRRNHSYQLMLELIQESRPDIIALVEPDQRWLDAMVPIKDRYPFNHVIPRDDNYGLALFSQYSLENKMVQQLTEKDVPTLSAEIRFNGKGMRILVTHPPPPKKTAGLIWRDRQMDSLSRFAYNKGVHVLVCGDFNITPWSRSFRRMEHKGNLVDSTRGFGFQPTWPVDHRWFRVPIDHCLVSPGIQIVRRKVGPKIGSDHLPVIIDFRLSQLDE
jgi:endonuclease/exonuclease/phosphatase (EEP) superfamily protein YafD